MARDVARNPPPITPQSPSLEHGVPDTRDQPPGTSACAVPGASRRVAFAVVLAAAAVNAVAIVYSDTSVPFCSMYAIESRTHPTIVGMASAVPCWSQCIAPLAIVMTQIRHVCAQV